MRGDNIREAIHEALQFSGTPPKKTRYVEIFSENPQLNKLNNNDKIKETVLQRVKNENTVVFGKKNGVSAAVQLSPLNKDREKKLLSKVPES